MVFENLLWRHGIAERLRHFTAVGVDEKSVGEHLLIGRRAIHCDRCLERRLEPAAVLIRAFEVEVGGVLQLTALIHDGEMAHARVEPHIECVGDLLIERRIRRAEQVGCVEFEPRLDPLLLDFKRDFFDKPRRVWMQFLCLFIDEKRNWNAPGTLT